MSKKNVVKCNYADTPEPRLVGGLVCLRTPMPLTIRKGQTIPVSTQVKFDCPVLIVGHFQKTVKVVNASDVVMPGQQVQAELEALEDMMFERGDTVVMVVPLTSTEVSFEP